MGEISDAEKKIERERMLRNYDGPDKVVSSIELWEKLKDRAAAIQTMQSGIGFLDELTGGFETEQVIVISGPTKMGKTLLCDTICRNLRDKSIFSTFFTYEVSPHKFVQSHQDPGSVVFLPSEHKPRDLSWLKDRCEEAVLKYGCKAIFIDHLHYVIDMMTRNNLSLEIGSTMRYLRSEIALDLGVAVFIVCHMGKIDKKDGEPSMDHLRDSSFVAQEADKVWVCYRHSDVSMNGNLLESMNDNNAIIKVEADRQTGTMGGKVKVRKEGLRLVPTDWPNPAPKRKKGAAYG